MKTDAVLYVDEHVTDVDLNFLDLDVIALLSERLSGIESISSICYSLPESYDGKLKNHGQSVVRSSDDIASWKELFTTTGADNLVCIYADAPFCSATVIDEMLALHAGSLAEFTYSENVPEGLGCEIYAASLLEVLPEETKHSLPLAQVIKKNINQFDVELFYKGPDLRNKRLSFRVSDARNRKIMEHIYHRHADFPEYEHILPVIDAYPDVLYVGPSYLEIELTGRSEIETIYSYRPLCAGEHVDMPVQIYKKILQDASAFGLPLAICLGGSGDPLLHPHFYEILTLTREHPFVTTIIIETDGIKADENFAGYLAEAKDSRIKLIVEMNGYNRETYTAVHQHDAFDVVYQNIMQLREHLGKEVESIYVQVMKINETEPLLDAYYDFWEKEKVPIILQKQNTFLGKIKDRRYYDLSPIERTPCWHLQRDLYILANGEVAFCKQDIDGSHTVGNIQTNSLEEIWHNKKDFFINDYQKKYAKKPDCSLCDEWYTFNL